MMNSIIWKGVSSTTINGLLISELPPISRPAMRVKETTIDGRDGSIIEDLGYSSYDKEVVIGLHGNFDINKVIKYFTGEGEVVFSNEPDKVYTAKIVGHIDYNRLLRYRQATIPFRVQPFKHKLFEAYKPAPTEAVSGTILVINDIEDAKLKTFSIYGKTIQNGTPTPENPVELVSVGDSGSISVNVTGKNGTQNMTVATPNGLYGIPVSSGGNYTDANGQQWICDEIDFARGVYVRRCFKEVIAFTYQESLDRYSALLSHEANTKCADGIGIPLLCETLAFNPNAGNGAQEQDGIRISTSSPLYAIARHNGEAIANATVLYPVATPIESPLPAEELVAYAGLDINEPNTTVQNDVNAYMKVEYFKPYEVFNEGLETSKPIMVLKGEGSVVISVNGLEIFTYTFPEGENEVVIDSEKEDAYLGDVLKNRNMNGEFPVLLPGTNVIEWSGYVSSIEILPRSRWL